MKMQKASPEKMMNYLKVLTEDIGVRLAGSDSERKAAEYIASTCQKYGGKVTIEEFPVWERAVEEEVLEIEINGEWISFPCSLFGCATTTNGETLEAPIVFFDSQGGYQREDLSFMKGKAVVHLGCHLDSREKYRRLMDAEPAFLLFVDTRYPGAAALADGLFPSYTAEFGSKPTVNVAYMDAWNWKAQNASAARLRVCGGRRRSLSQNVISEIPGSDPDAGIIYAGGHHDTQAGTVGADDNAVGSAAIIELTRLLAGLKLKRTIKLISFGAEEQLSVGSSNYVRAHRQEVEETGVFMFNFDGYGSLMGWTEIVYNGPEILKASLAESFHKNDIFYNLSEEIEPFTDQFPFAAAGTPGLWLNRRNCAAGRFFHHRFDDNISRVCPEVITTHVDSAADFIALLAEAEELPAMSIPEELRPEIKNIWQDFYGGWEGLK
jgi:aminopeptidase YwaD